MSKGGAPDVTTNAVDPDIKEAFLANFQNAQSVAGALPVQQFAGFNPMYQAGEEALVNAGLAGPGISGTDLAAQMAAYGGIYQPAQVQGVRANLGFGASPMAMSPAGGGASPMAMSPAGGGASPMAMSALDGGMMPVNAMPRRPRTEADWDQYSGLALFAPGTDMEQEKAKFLAGGQRTAPAGGVQASPSQGGLGGVLASSGQGGFGGGVSSEFMPQQIGSIADYMNPYTSQVRANALADLESSRQMAIQQAGDRATQARAFGGSRQGVAEALTNAGFARQAGTLGTQLNENAFNNAVQLQQADINRQQQAFLANQTAGLQGAQLRLGGAQQLGSLAAQQQALRLGGAQAVMGAGSARQAADQQQMDAIRNIGLQRLGIVQSSLGAQPANLGGTVSTPTYSNPAAGALGGAMAGFQMGGPYGAIAGGLLGALGG